MTIYTSGDVCKLLGITYRQLDYLLKTVGDVSRTSGNMRLFCEEDIQRIKNLLGIRRSDEE